MGGDELASKSAASSQLSQQQLDDWAREYTVALHRYFLKRGCQQATAEDLVQDVLVRMTKLVSAGQIENPEAYLMQTASSVWNDHWRKRKVRSHGAHVEYEDPRHSYEEISPDRVYEGKERIGHVIKALKALDERSRQIFFLRRFEGMSQKEVAARLGVSVSLVEKDMMRAIAHVAEWFGDADE